MWGYKIFSLARFARESLFVPPTFKTVAPPLRMSVHPSIAKATPAKRRERNGHLLPSGSPCIIIIIIISLSDN